MPELHADDITISHASLFCNLVDTKGYFGNIVVFKIIDIRYVIKIIRCKMNRLNV